MWPNYLQNVQLPLLGALAGYFKKSSYLFLIQSFWVTLSLDNLTDLKFRYKMTLDSMQECLITVQYVRKVWHIEVIEVV
jgi:hypothetical protein